MSVLYDEIGQGYAAGRRTDPRIARAIREALGNARSVVNVGAGTGSYEPTDRRVVAVEPSAVMISQRGAAAAPAVRARAEALPFAAESFDAALAVLTMHHWADRAGGITECRRVARDRVVAFTWDPASAGFWLVQDYFPEILALDRTIFSSIGEIATCFRRAEVRVVPVPADCLDGFLGAWWRRPDAYLRADVRDAISSFRRIADPRPALARLESDLASGAWHAKHGGLLAERELDVGYRLVIGHR